MFHIDNSSGLRKLFFQSFYFEPEGLLVLIVVGHECFTILIE